MYTFPKGLLINLDIIFTIDQSIIKGITSKIYLKNNV